MENTISALTTAVTVDNLWAVVADSIPFLVVAITFGLGYYLYRRLTKGVGKAKVRS